MRRPPLALRPTKRGRSQRLCRGRSRILSGCSVTTVRWRTESGATAATRLSVGAPFTTCRIGSLAFNPVLVPATATDIRSGAGCVGRVRRGWSALQAPDVWRSSSISYDCAVCPGPGTLWTREPADRVTVLLGSTVKARATDDATPGLHLIAGQAGQDTATTAVSLRGAQIAFIGQPLLVERQDVSQDREGVDQRDRSSRPCFVVRNCVQRIS